MHRFRPVSATCIALIFCLLFSCTSRSGGTHATLQRDEFGVPHIFAPTPAAAAYVHGYAQGEDRLEQILRHYRWAEGTLAEALGKQYLDSDYNARVWQHAKISKAEYTKIPAPTRAVLEAFIAGLKAYMHDHPDQVPDWAPEIYPWHIVALARAFIWGWPEGEAWDDLHRRKPVEKVKTRGSNQWTLAGSRTASGKPMLLIDPHLDWAGEGKWTEVRVHTSEGAFAGMVIPGMPYLALGHNQFIAWAATTGGPDCGDIFEIETDPENPLRYRYDDAWRTISVDSVRLAYRDGDAMKSETRKIERSHHGPIVKREGNKAYAMALPYENEVLIVETMAQITRAKSVDELRQALAAEQFLPQNLMAADVHGNIYYQRTGRVPIRPAGFDYSYPVPGNTSKSEWRGVLAAGNHVQILNPPTGYMQNCNISPGMMMHEGAPRALEYLTYAYNDRQDRTNPRGRRAVSLLKNARAITVEQAMAIVFDTTVDATGIQPYQQALQQAFIQQGGGFASLRGAVRALVNWNGSTARDNPDAALFQEWRLAMKRRGIDLPAPTPAGKPDARQQLGLLETLREACDSLQKNYGSLRVPYGETLRLRRGDKDLPLAGISFGGLGLSTLRNIWYRKPGEHGVYTASGGQSCPMLVVLSEPIESYSILPYGISDDPKSPHYFDQMGLFSEMKMKPVWFDRQALQAHVSATREFQVPAEFSGR